MGCNRVSPSQAVVTIRFSSHQTCLIGNADVACSDIGSLLHAMRLPTNSDIRLVSDQKVKYALFSTALTSLKNAGYSTKSAVLSIDNG